MAVLGTASPVAPCEWGRVRFVPETRANESGRLNPEFRAAGAIPASTKERFGRKAASAKGRSRFFPPTF